MKVKVRYPSDYTKCPKGHLIATLHERDELISRLQYDLSAAQEQEQLWKSEATKLAEETRTLKAQKAAKLPCNIGDTVYALFQNLPLPGCLSVTQIHIDELGTTVIAKDNHTGATYNYSVDRFGSDIFTNIDAAFAAIKKARGWGKWANQGNHPEIPKKAPEKPTRRLILGPFIQGEWWYCCPHCRRGIAAHSLKKTNRPGVYLCPYCGNEVNCY